MRFVDVNVLVGALQNAPDINMISLLTKSTTRHVERMKGRFASSTAANVMKLEDWQFFECPRMVCGVRLVPMMQWLDTTHLARVCPSYVSAQLLCALQDSVSAESIFRVI
jgi:hypothetical protein